MKANTRLLAGFFISICFLGLSGCTSPSPPVVAVNAATQMNPVSTDVPTKTLPVPTVDIPVTDTDTPLPSFTETIVPSSTPSPEEICPEREIGIQPDFLLPGTIIFNAYGRLTEGTSDRLFSLSSQDLEIRRFLDDLAEYDRFGRSQVSHDGKWLVAGLWNEQLRKYELFLTTSGGQERKTIPWDDENWYRLRGWHADNQHLLILPPTKWLRIDEIIVYNPFTGEQEVISPTFPDPELIYTDQAWRYVGSDATTVYDPTLTRVFYIENYETMVLWDIENSQELWRFVEPNMISAEIPTWSPDGNYLALVDLIGDKFFYDERDEIQILLVNRDGEVVWRSNSFSFYKNWPNSLDVTWSPNGRYLVFDDWKDPEVEEQRLLILDTKSMEVLDFCVENAPFVWSPDSKQILVAEGVRTSAELPTEGVIYKGLVIDLSKNVLVEFDLSAIPLWPMAWLLNEP